MKRALIVLFFFMLLSIGAYAQKTAYIPAYLLDTSTIDGAQFTWSKTYEDSNFIVIWGNTVGLTPATYTLDTNLAFDPAVILDTMEFIYHRFKALGFLNDSAGTNLHQYKIPIIMHNTWGPTGSTGYANGGYADGVIGAFWVHPIAMHGGHVAAHELTHSLQAQMVIDYRTTHGLGAVWDNAGIFWETHANFMRNQLYPTDVSAWGMDQTHIEAWGDWKNTYENYELLMAIQETDGINMVNRLWRESLSKEYPLQTYKRLMGYNQSDLNDKLYMYARRMPTFDFTANNIGNIFRQYRDADMLNDIHTVQSIYNIPKKVAATANHYAIPIEQAPEEYGYNIIPLYQNPDSCSVIVKFKGHTDANAHAGWRYGYVTEHPNGTVSRYGTMYRSSQMEFTVSLQGDETKMYLVVMGAPNDRITTDTSNDTWHGYPKHFRFPYELTISGGVPEGYQAADSFRLALKINGHLHPNGGGWVDNAATVASTVYVGPYAMVVGNANITGSVHIDNTSYVKDATLSGNVQVLDNAFVNTGTYSNNAIIKGKAYAENDIMSGNAMIDMRASVANYTLAGNIEVGGDVVVYNVTGNCNNGVYYRMTNYYQDNLLECDGRTASYPTNLDVNNTYPLFAETQMALDCNCGLLPGCLPLSTNALQPTPYTLMASPNPAAETVKIEAKGIDKIIKMEVILLNSIGSVVSTSTFNSSEGTLNLAELPAGVYLAKVKLNNQLIVQTVKVLLEK